MISPLLKSTRRLSKCRSPRPEKKLGVPNFNLISKKLLIYLYVPNYCNIALFYQFDIVQAYIVETKLMKPPKIKLVPYTGLEYQIISLLLLFINYKK